MKRPKVKISCSSNVYVEQLVFEKKGDCNVGHEHTFDHQTLLASGALEAVVNGKTSFFKAPHIIFIRAGVSHTFTALEDNTVAYCVHALRRGDGIDDIIDPEDVPQGVDLTRSEIHQKADWLVKSKV
jgi:quercetin dioxygenase-like cupin family protein